MTQNLVFSRHQFMTGAGPAVILILDSGYVLNSEIVVSWLVAGASLIGEQQKHAVHCLHVYVLLIRIAREKALKACN
jgi:hypothetical protein